MNSKANTAFVLLCCVLLLSHPVGFVAPASAASTAPEHHVDFCAIDFEPVENDLETAAEEVLDILPRWYQDVARGNSIILHVYDDRYPDDPYPKMSFVTYVGEDFQVRTAFGDYYGGFGGLELMLTVDTDCQTLNRIISSDDRGDAIVDEIWEGHITYYGHGPGADAAVVYADSLLTGAYVMETRQSGNLGDFINGALAPVTKTYEELHRNYERFFTPFEESPVRPGGN